jgi:hypothetical protein
MMDLGIDIRIIYEDRDMFELRVRASNGEFTAQAEMYVDLDSCRELARALRGFPTTRTDVREFELGTFKSDHAGGGARMRFSCLDSVGHSAVQVQIRNDGRRSGRSQAVATFDIPIEASGIDSFVEQLDKMSGVGEGAQLKATA